MEEHIGVQEDARYGAEAVAYTAFDDDCRRLFYLFPVDEDGELIEEHVRVEDMTGRAVDTPIPDDVRSFVTDWIAERRREQIVRELEHEIGTPDVTRVPDVGDRAEELQRQYSEGKISLFELEEELEEAMK